MSTERERLTIEKGTYLEDLIRAYPRLVVSPAEKGLTYMKCGMVSWETIEEAARKANIDDIDALVAELAHLVRSPPR